MNSGLDWNIVRASWFAQNFSESLMAEDIAEVVVTVLSDINRQNKLFEVTGPELLTFEDYVDEIC
jgi:uncharacterized protein YbjT (DUF2867 family)